MDDKLKKIKKQYEDVPIPKELDEVIENSLKRKPKKRNKVSWLLGSAAAASIIFIGGINASPAMAKSLAQIPVLSAVVEVLTFTEYEVKDGNYEANIKVPQITGDSDEIQALNAQFEAEGKALYEEFTEEISYMDGGHLGIDSGYIVETDTDQLLSMGRYVVNTVGSSSTVMQYTTIDKEKQIALTLPSLFKDASYIPAISEYIQQQMRDEMIETNGESTYWLVETDSMGFEEITKEQNFFITEQGKLVIAFDKYEVAPGYMGLVKFEIPTELIQEMLVSYVYIH
ncbi:anti-sigma factor [Solibacillus sp. R5-41]|uniref:DUF3298 domain-containing protein n=1 Tax=Solibacillus sp. R5-41 TaxID=2048654 RepID=UPI000C127941|nr:DUF3298 domain-containing protein [Solibacillus sp. R5-41]ATP40461.1 anti-sigma factor [Solibacillus sp. R5-41]